MATGTMRDKMAEFIADHIKKVTGTNEFIQLSYNSNGEPDNSSMHKLKSELEGLKGKLDKSVTITSIDAVSNSPVLFIQKDRGIKRCYKDVLEQNHASSTGVWQVTFSTSDIIVVGSWFNFRGSMETIIGGTRKAWDLLSVELKKSSIRQEKPKNGIFTIGTMNSGDGKIILKYEEANWVFNGSIVHPKIPEVMSEVQTFFSNIPLFSRFGQVPFRKLILIGPPGTGKTSINFLIAETLKKNYCIVFSQDINNIYYHMKLCAKHKVPTVIFYDDSEQILSMPSADVLNFLSGVNTPNNPKGTMIVFTSNMTQHIEDRILRRPGRIDRIFNIHPLTGYDLLTCAKMYFNFLNWEEKSDKEWIDLFMVKHKEEDGLVGMTGAEIQGLAQSCYAFANSSGAETINYELIKRLKETIQETFTEAYHMIAQNSLARRYDTKKLSERTPIGFNKSSEDNYAF